MFALNTQFNERGRRGERQIIKLMSSAAKSNSVDVPPSITVECLERKGDSELHYTNAFIHTIPLPMFITLVPSISFLLPKTWEIGKCVGNHLFDAETLHNEDY